MTDEVVVAHDGAPTSGLKDSLLDQEVLRETRVAGVYQRSWTFESVVRGLEAVARRCGEQVAGEAGGFGEPHYFPPVIPTRDLEDTGYLESFPDLIGAVHTFRGGDAEHAELLDRAARDADWAGMLHPSNLMMSSAACHALYPTLPRELPPGGHRAELQGFCFRHEPSSSVTRMQSFRMHELVRIGSPAEAMHHRDTALASGLDALSALGLAVRAVPANDPFFGRAGRLLARNQRSDELKFEIVCEVDSSHHPTAISSANLHLDHFGEPFGIRTADGETAHSACFAFGLDRIALALFATHGSLAAEWPDEVLAQLGIDRAGPG